MKEKALFSVGANLFKGLEGVSGLLSVYEDGLYFKPHPFNFQKDIVFIPFDRIIKVQKGKTMGIIPNGVKIYCPDICYNFACWKSQKLIEYIKTRIGQ